MAVCKWLLGKGVSIIIQPINEYSWFCYFFRSIFVGNPSFPGEGGLINVGLIGVYLAPNRYILTKNVGMFFIVMMTKCHMVTRPRDRLKQCWRNELDFYLYVGYHCHQGPKEVEKG